MDVPPGATTHLTWGNVALGFTFVAFDAVFSRVVGLGVSVPLLTAATRCIVQLAIMALVLQKVFEAENPWGVAGLAFLLNLLGTIEVVVNMAKMRFSNIFPIVLVSLLCSTIPVSILGVRFAMSAQPFWRPNQFIPIVGMLCGNAISGIVISLNFVLTEIIVNRDKIETYLAFGASRLEACLPVAKEALRLALATPINQMSVIGIIAIPGTMTGAILGGAPVQDAARLQMVIMFMIAAASVLSPMLVTLAALVTVVDSEHRIRACRVDTRKHWVWRVRERCVAWFTAKVAEMVNSVKRTYGTKKGEPNGEGAGEGNDLLS